MHADELHINGLRHKPWMDDEMRNGYMYMTLLLYVYKVGDGLMD